MLEIVVSEGEKLLLQKAGLKNVISFCLFLSYGKIKNLQKQEYKILGNVTLSIQEQLKKIEKDCKTVRIWYSALDNEDVCTLYFLIFYFFSKDIKIQVCEVSKKDHFSLGSYDTSEISSLLKKTRTLSREEMHTYMKCWQQLECENSDLRILQNGILTSVSFDYLDIQMLNMLKQYDSIRYWAFIGECMSKRLCGFYGDIFFTTRLEECIQNGQVEICDVKKEKNGLGEYKEQQYIRIEGKNEKRKRKNHEE